MTVLDPPLWVETAPDSYEPYTVRDRRGEGRSLAPCDLYELKQLYRQIGACIAIAEERKR